jgi:hypothetical protein
MAWPRASPDIRQTNGRCMIKVYQLVKPQTRAVLALLTRRQRRGSLRSTLTSANPFAVPRNTAKKHWVILRVEMVSRWYRGATCTVLVMRDFGLYSSGDLHLIGVCATHHCLST